jgi:hypothetical protein
MAKRLQKAGAEGMGSWYTILAALAIAAWLAVVMNNKR